MAEGCKQLGGKITVKAFTRFATGEGIEKKEDDFAAEVASDVTRRVVQLVGGCGYTREYPFERMMRDAKITEIYEGTSEVQMMVISGWMGVK